ncbi:MAG: EVE domain-containing protein [Bacteroidota bacterium]
MNYWLLKSEPNAYSWDDLINDKKTPWDGVRNYQARNNMKDMNVGDMALFYHSVNEKSVVGVAKITSEFYQDPTTDDERWVVVDVEPEYKLKKPIHLSQIKADERLSDMVLVNNSRLSVQPVRKEEFDIIIGLSEE